MHSANTVAEDTLKRGTVSSMKNSVHRLVVVQGAGEGGAGVGAREGDNRKGRNHRCEGRSRSQKVASVIKRVITVDTANFVLFLILSIVPYNGCKLVPNVLNGDFLMYFMYRYFVYLILSYYSGS